ncbi:hypothetical protein AMTRI_Chr08g207440 [Amborella trichopoda]
MKRMHPLNVRRSALITPIELIRHLMRLGGMGAFPQGVQQSLQDQQRDLVFRQQQVLSLVVGEELRPIGAEHRVVVCVACCVLIYGGAVEFKQEATVEQHHVKELGDLHSGQLIRPLIAGPELPLHSPERLLYGLDHLQADISRVLQAIKEVEERTMVVVLHGLQVRDAIVQRAQRNNPGSYEAPLWSFWR